nr:A-agglutinin anchorage subunit [Ipomoea batatas]GME19483.1 A-agglutinin anchorage subunit [Ipomoea batatas]
MRDESMKPDSQKRKNYEKKKIRSPLLDLGNVQQKRPKLSSPASCGKQRLKSSKENILAVPISLKPQKNASRLQKCQTGENPIQVLDLDGNDSSSENFTPVGKRKTADSANFEDSNVKTSTNVVKTPPIKSSVSPEIQCNVLSATSASSAVTPCYSAGHVLSGISDKRKCRPIGILTAPLDCEKSSKKSCIVGMIDDEKADSLVPLPAEATMHWLSSPCGEENQIRGPELPYSPSFCCKVDCDVLHFQRMPCCKATELHEERNFIKSPFSGSSVSSDNVIQTPSSDSASDRHTTFSCLNVDDKHEFESELDDGLAEIVNGVRLPLQNDQIF